jgi:hypothetical protein
VSFYKLIEKEAAQELTYSNMPTSKFTEEVSDNVLNGASGRYRDDDSFLVEWLLPYLSQQSFVSLLQLCLDMT